VKERERRKERTKQTVEGSPKDHPNTSHSVSDGGKCNNF